MIPAKSAPLRSPQSALAATLLACTLFFVAGCQEDPGVSAAAKLNSAETSSEKERIALGSLKEVLGQKNKSDTEKHGNQGSVSTGVPNGNVEIVAIDDSRATRSLPTAEGRPSLRWAPPAARVDGSRLYIGEIHSYRIYFKLRHQSKFKTITVPGAEQTEFALDGLNPGVYDFAITTLDSKGLESLKSDVLSVTII